MLVLVGCTPLVEDVKWPAVDTAAETAAQTALERRYAAFCHLHLIVARTPQDTFLAHLVMPPTGSKWCIEYTAKYPDSVLIAYARDSLPHPRDLGR